MIPVYVREDVWLEGVLLGEFCPGDLPMLVSLFRDATTYMKESEDLHSCVYCDSQFVIDAAGVIFEIIVEIES